MRTCEVDRYLYIGGGGFQGHIQTIKGTTHIYI